MRDYFCGWYFKCQSDKETLAIIPAMHRSHSTASCSIQFITQKGVRNVTLPYRDLHKQSRDLHIDLGKNHFGKDGITLCLHMPDGDACGALRFGPWCPIGYDIMGPFRYVPFMECRHDIRSMLHTVNGDIFICGEHYRFRDALGYIEGDRGHSFPRAYAWTQCFFKGGSLMLSVADIPMGAFHFTGVIGVIRLLEKEYRLATYLGAKAVKIGDGEIVIRQGDSTFTARLIEKHPLPLLAPAGGTMCRTIHESAVCRAAYRFTQKGHTLLSFESDKASFEYEYGS
ncbi:MAG: hypothetical protein IJX39_06840 [Clostridia bacterium]|nr:hypothetical protein [Clostridia bacterium]